MPRLNKKGLECNAVKNETRTHIKFTKRGWLFVCLNHTQKKKKKKKKKKEDQVPPLNLTVFAAISGIVTHVPIVLGNDNEISRGIHPMMSALQLVELK
jgi:hypothetical protein